MSLLPLAGMFIFGGKKKKEEKKLPKHIDEIMTFTSHTGGTVHILAEATGKNREEIMRDLDADILSDQKMYIRSHREKNGCGKDWTKTTYISHT